MIDWSETHILLIYMYYMYIESAVFMLFCFR